MYGQNMWGHCMININTVQLVGSKICVAWAAAWKAYIIKY